MRSRCARPRAWAAETWASTASASRRCGRLWRRRSDGARPGGSLRSTGTVERGSRARAALALLPAARAPQFLALISAQVPAEVEHPIQDVVGLQVGLAAVEVHEPSRNEAPFFIEHEPDAPVPARD